MEKEIINLFMKEDIVNKIILLANIFNINVTNYQYVIDNNKRKVVFYDQDNNYIGHIEVDSEKISDEIIYDLDNFKIELLTDLGKVIGNYSPHTSLLSYILLFNKDSLYNKLMGNIKFSNHNNAFSQIYDGISASLEAFNDEASLFRVNFNYFDINGIFSIIKHYPTYEKLEYDIWNGIKIKYQNNDRKCKIVVGRGKDNNFEDAAECNFDDNLVVIPLEHYNPLLGTSIWQNAGLIDIESIINALNTYFPNVKEFILEAKDLFTVQTLTGETISLYDNLANICFKDDDKKAYLTFATMSNDVMKKR